MRYSLMPTLNEGDRDSIKAWLESSLRHPRLCSRYPLTQDRLAVYIDGRAYGLRGGNWDMSTGSQLVLFVGQDEMGLRTVVPLIDRLAVLSTIITAVDLWSDLIDVFSAAVNRVMLESYNEVMAGLVQTQGPATGLAFSADRQRVAARFGESWHLSDGSVVDIGSAEWAEAAVVQ